mmetsp:Transcript_63369/g.137940  ORF Transcript_63369/g.137940 Transcript_63369/m.137940 type:complete len:434 (-) Transcript_63369:77-1378(-)
MATSALVTLYRHADTFQETLQFTFHAAIAKDPHYILFRSEDFYAWVTFSSVFAFLIFVDNAVWHRSPKAMTIRQALLYTLFWILCACAFCMWIYHVRGSHDAFMWMSGYMLEWMLSFDNLFIFHVIFTVYGTPDNLKQRPLYLGICGAVFFRLMFIFVGEYLLHAMFVMHFVFGIFLVYTGVKTACTDDEDDDPSKHPVVQWLQHKVPFVGAYDEGGAFFVRVPVNECGEPLLPDLPSIDKIVGQAEAEKTPVLALEAGQVELRYGTVDFDGAMTQARKIFKERPQGQLRATMLFLVVCCLEMSDLLFAVDSVSAIVAQVNDLFLAYTSAVFAMLGLRATFFIIDRLVSIFALLKYGVAAVLVFIGFKLITSRFIHIPPGIVCAILITALSSSMVASVVQDRLGLGSNDKEEAAESNETEDSMQTPAAPIPVA